MSSNPVIITTWPFGLAAARAGYARLVRAVSALDAIEAAANVTELDPEVNSVGYGGLPDADGVVELDAAIMNGPGHTAGAVAGLVGFRRAISVARRVMERTPHVMLVGDRAARFARDEGFPEEELLTPAARARWEEWQASRSGPDVAHFDDPAESTDGDLSRGALRRPSLTPDNHDTIGLCGLDVMGNLAAGCTTSGMAWKLPGRVGDSPIIGSGLYVDNEVGAAAGTGHGDEMMKACLSYASGLPSCTTTTAPA
jgi:isoaspartyl peptidase/L-asparaginase-like protein (Ntn-hydrolase superfamily)